MKIGQTQNTQKDGFFFFIQYSEGKFIDWILIANFIKKIKGFDIEIKNLLEL